MRKLDSSAFSLIEVLVTLALLGVASVGLMNVSKNFFDSNKSNLIRTEAADIKNTVAKMLSCEKTFASYGTARPIPCSGNVILLDKLGRPLFNNGIVGNWTLEAECEVLGPRAVNGLSIYITQKRVNGTFKEEALRHIPLDRSHPASALFLPDVRPCHKYFENQWTVSGCPDGVAGVDFQTNSYDCLPPCQYIKYWDAMGAPPIAVYRLSGTVINKGGFVFGGGGISTPSCPTGTALRSSFLSNATKVGWQTTSPATGSTNNVETVYQHTLVCCAAK